MSLTQYDLAKFISALVRGDFKDLTDLQLAAKLTALLEDGMTKSKLTSQIEKALQLDQAVRKALKAEE